MTSTANDPRLRLKEWLATGEAQLRPLTLPQRELWENSPVPPGDPANHICATIEIRGKINFDFCEKALEDVVARQEVLRTSFLMGKDQAVQIVRARAETVLRRRAMKEEGLDEALSRVFDEPFDLVRGPLYRVEMLHVATDHHVLALVFHHAIADGWSLGIFVEDFVGAYARAVRASGDRASKTSHLRDPSSAVERTSSEWGAADRAHWKLPEIEHLANYWIQRLEGSKLLLGAEGGNSPLPPLQRRVSVLSPDLCEVTLGLARRTGVTLFSTLLTAFQVALFRWNGTRDVVLGTPHANRAGQGVRSTMGYFAGVVPLRVRLEPDRTFAETMRQNHTQTVEDFAHAMPFAELAKAMPPSAMPQRHPVFDVRFALQNHPVPDIQLPGLSTHLRTRSTGTARFDLGCELTEDGGSLEVVWLYRHPFFQEEQILQLDRLFRDILTEAGTSPEFCPASLLTN